MGSFVSFAQNCEDVMLARAFRDRERGTWVDVGASHPVDDSVTKAFSLRGWTGVNIEPLEHMHALLEADRPNDVNLRLALSDAPGHVDYYRGQGAFSGLSTLDGDIARGHIAKGYPFDVVQLSVTTLDLVLREHAPGRVDFLKVDVEGHEHAVLRGAALERHAPRVVVVEATEPSSPRPNHQAWEPLVLAAGYTLALFDGLNRFYVHRDCPELLERLSVPANVFDGHVSYRHLVEVAAERERAEAAAASAAAAQREALSLTREVAALIVARNLWPAAYPLDDAAGRRLLLAPHRCGATLEQALEALVRGAHEDTTVVLWLPAGSDDAGELYARVEAAVDAAGFQDGDLLVVLEPDDDATAARLVAAVTDVVAPLGVLASLTSIVSGVRSVTLEELAASPVPA